MPPAKRPSALRARRAAPRAADWFGVAMLVGLLASGYVYNLTLVQIGVPDFGERVLGMAPRDVAWMMAGLAVV